MGNDRSFGYYCRGSSRCDIAQRKAIENNSPNRASPTDGYSSAKQLRYCFKMTILEHAMIEVKMSGNAADAQHESPTGGASQGTSFCFAKVRTSKF